MVAPTTRIKPTRWNASPGLVSPEWGWFSRGSMLTSGVLWEGGGNPFDFIGRNYATLIASPPWLASQVGQSVDLNDGARKGQTIELTNFDATKLDGLTTFTYAVYFTFTGTSSADEDTLGLMWSTLQGSTDANAQRILVRYDSANTELDFYTQTTAGVGLTGGSNLADGKPHACVFRYNSPNAEKSIWVDGKRIATTAAQTGALSSAAHSKIPEVFGGHVVTYVGTDAPRVRGHTWAFDGRAWSDYEIAQWSRDPFGPFRMRDDYAAWRTIGGTTIYVDTYITIKSTKSLHKAVKEDYAAIASINSDIDLAVFPNLALRKKINFPASWKHSLGQNVIQLTDWLTSPAADSTIPFEWSGQVAFAADASLILASLSNTVKTAQLPFTYSAKKAHSIDFVLDFLQQLQKEVLVETQSTSSLFADIKARIEWKGGILFVADSIFLLDWQESILTEVALSASSKREQRGEGVFSITSLASYNISKTFIDSFTQKQEAGAEIPLASLLASVFDAAYPLEWNGTGIFIDGNTITFLSPSRSLSWIIEERPRTWMVEER